MFLKFGQKIIATILVILLVPERYQVYLLVPLLAVPILAQLVIIFQKKKLGSMYGIAKYDDKARENERTLETNEWAGKTALRLVSLIKIIDTVLVFLYFTSLIYGGAMEMMIKNILVILLWLMAIPLVKSYHDEYGSTKKGVVVMKRAKIQKDKVKTNYLLGVSFFEMEHDGGKFIGYARIADRKKILSSEDVFFLNY